MTSTSDDFNNTMKDNVCKQFIIVHINIRSLISNLSKLKDFISTHNPDIVCETWLKPHNIVTSMIDKKNYKLFREDRLLHAGGVGIYVRNSLECSVINIDKSIEQLWIKFKIQKQLTVLGVVYNPHRALYHDFLSSLHNSLLEVSYCTEHIIVIGDFNIDYSKTEAATSELISLCENFDLHQNIREPTRFN